VVELAGKGNALMGEFYDRVKIRGINEGDQL
jgi:hypothetical protein